MADQDLKIKIKSEYQNAGLDELKRALKENTAAMDEMKRSGQQGTAAWNEAKTRAQALTESIKETSREYKGLDANVKASKFQMLEFGENLTVVIAGIKAAIDGLVNLGKEMYASALEGTQFENLKQHFVDLSGGVKEAETLLGQFRKATSGKLNEEDLIKYSNKMQDLGYSTNQTTQFLDLSETASRNLGVSIEEGSNKILTFIETGRGKGLKDLGISISDVKMEMDKLAKSQGLDLKNLDDETTKRLRSDAVLKLYGKSVDEITRKEYDHAGGVASLGVAFENAKHKIGELVSGVFTVLANIFGTSAEKVAIFITVLGGLTTALITVVTAITLLKLAFAQLNITTGGLLTAVGVIVTLAVVVTGLASASDKAEMSLEGLNKAIGDTKTELETLQTVAKTSADNLPKEKQAEYNKTLDDLINKFPEIVSGYDEKTGKAIVDKTKLDELIKSEQEHLNLMLEQKQAKDQVKIEDEIEAANKLIEAKKKYEEEKKDIMLVLKGYEGDNSEYAKGQIIKFTKELELLDAKIKAAGSSTSGLTSYFKDLIKESYKLGNTEDILNFIKKSIYGNENATIAFNDAIKGLARDSEKEWKRVINVIGTSAQLTAEYTAAVNALKSAMKSGNLFDLVAAGSQLNAVLEKAKSLETKNNDSSSPTGSRTHLNNVKEEKIELDEIQKLQEEIKNLESERTTLVSRYGEHAEIVFKIEEKIYENKKKILELEREHNSWVKPVSIEMGVYEKSPTERGPVDVDETIKKEQASKEFEIRKEKIKKANEEISQSMAETTTAVGNLFGAFLKGDNAKDAFKQFLKSIVNTFVTSIQAMLLASTAAANAKAITSFGITLIKDFPLIAAGWAALELAKGVIGALAQGGDFGPGAYLVGERGPELMLTGSGGHMVNNRDFNNMVMAGKQQSQSVNNILNFGIDVDWIKVRQSTDMRFTKYKNSGRL